VPHETAHLVVFRLFGPGMQPHGREWRAIMGLFGAEPTRCHDYDVDGLQARQLRRYHYRCACRSHQVTSIRHNRIMRGQTYLCRRCGGVLQWMASGTEQAGEEA
jgi:SprT protein